MLVTQPEVVRAPAGTSSPRVGQRLASGTFLKQINSTRYRKTVILYRRADAVYVARYLSDPPSRRDRMEVLTRTRAQQLYGELPNKLASWNDAFPHARFNDIRDTRDRQLTADHAAD